MNNFQSFFIHKRLWWIESAWAIRSSSSGARSGVLAVVLAVVLRIPANCEPAIALSRGLGLSAA